MKNQNKALQELKNIYPYLKTGKDVYIYHFDSHDQAKETLNLIPDIGTAGFLVKTGGTIMFYKKDEFLTGKTLGLLINAMPIDEAFLNKLWSDVDRYTTFRDLKRLNDAINLLNQTSIIKQELQDGQSAYWIDGPVVFDSFISEHTSGQTQFLSCIKISED